MAHQRSPVYLYFCNNQKYKKAKAPPKIAVTNSPVTDTEYNSPSINDIIIYTIAQVRGDSVSSKSFTNPISIKILRIILPQLN